MKTRNKLMAVVAMAGLAGFGLVQSALADNGGFDKSAVLTINGDTTLVTTAPAPANIPGLKTIYSGWMFRSPDTQAMETDDFSNPGQAFVDEGKAEWTSVEGSAGKSCASCHGDISSMKGVRAVMPKVNDKGQLWSLADYINDCRTNRMGAKPWKITSTPMRDMVGAISMQSRGLPMNVATDGPAAKFWKAGEKLYYTRFGELQLSCANCHEDHYGYHIRGDHLSQGQTNGFPVYRLKNGRLNTVQNRLFGCVRDTRAESFKIGSLELHELELYVASRGNGLSVEGVGVRP